MCCFLPVKNSCLDFFFEAVCAHNAESYFQFQELMLRRVKGTADRVAPAESEVGIFV